MQPPAPAHTRPPTDRAARLQRFAGSPWTWLLPAFAMLLLFRAYPMAHQAWLSLTDMRTATIGQARFVGLDNYRFIFTDPAFLGSLSFTFTFTVASMAASFTLGFALALLLNRPLRGRSLYRMLILTSWVISPLIVGYMWQMLLNESSAGVINGMLRAIGVPAVRWFSDPDTARLSVILVDIWRSSAYIMVFMLGGLQTIPRELLEAAMIDGASAWQRLRHVTLPLLSNLITIALIFTTIATFNVYELIVSLTGGGPGRATMTIGYAMFRTAFGGGEVAGLGYLGRGAATGMVMFVVTFAFTVAYLRVGIFGRGRS
jgi:arabinogalactan oligomer / maltooligosaccharide transport system permease protein